MIVLANDGISQSGVDALEAAGFEVRTENVPQDQLIDAINNDGISALLVRSATKVRKDLIDACPSLKLIGRGGVGMDNIDVDYARSKGIHVVNTPAASSQSVAELVMGQLFSISRFLYDASANMPNKGASEFKALKKKYGKGVELRGKTLGVIGLGRIGQYTAKYALGCGMNVIGCTHGVDKVSVNVEVNGQKIPVNIPLKSMEDVLAESDYISLHVPAQEDGSAVLGTAEFAKMKKGIRIVNAARGGVIDEDALIASLNDGTVSYCALDVFVNEPTPRADVLAHEKIASTPHIGAATVEAQDRIGEELAEQIMDLLGVPA